jgi:hypothetical protein
MASKACKMALMILYVVSGFNATDVSIYIGMRHNESRYSERAICNCHICRHLQPIAQALINFIISTTVAIGFDSFGFDDKFPVVQRLGAGSLTPLAHR